ncbi:MAG: zinc-ribbon domain-containing protein [Geminicoccaceae bacterium]|nr:zinc-ribbon domain-containing protein [Geminicoccaceae bacterium]
MSFVGDMQITCPSCGKLYNIPDESIGDQGRKVRCTSCSHRWQVMPAVAEEEDARRLAESLDRAAEEIDAEVGGDDDDDLDVDLDAAFDTRADEIFHDGDDDDGVDRPEAEDEDDRPEGADAGETTTRSIERQNIADKSPALSLAVVAGWLLLLVSVLTLGGLVIARDEIVDSFPGTQPIYQALGLPITRVLGLEIRDVITETLERDGNRVLRVKGEVHNVTSRERDVPIIIVKLLDGDNAAIDEQMVMVDQPMLPTESVARFTLDIPSPPADAKTFSVSFDLGE